MVLNGINWVHKDKIRSNGFERSQLGTQCKIQVLWSSKDFYWVHNDKLGQIVLKGVSWVHNIKSDHIVLKGINWVHYDKIRLNGVERSQLGTQYKNQDLSYGLERSQLGTICKTNNNT